MTYCGCVRLGRSTYRYSIQSSASIIVATLFNVPLWSEQETRMPSWKLCRGQGKKSMWQQMMSEFMHVSTTTYKKFLRHKERSGREQRANDYTKGMNYE